MHINAGKVCWQGPPARQGVRGQDLMRAAHNVDLSRGQSSQQLQKRTQSTCDDGTSNKSQPSDRSDRQIVRATERQRGRRRERERGGKIFANRTITAETEMEQESESGEGETRETNCQTGRETDDRETERRKRRQTERCTTRQRVRESKRQRL
jgi:hypothetical protein